MSQTSIKVSMEELTMLMKNISKTYIPNYIPISRKVWEEPYFLFIGSKAVEQVKAAAIAEAKKALEKVFRPALAKMLEEKLTEQWINPPYISYGPLHISSPLTLQDFEKSSADRKGQYYLSVGSRVKLV